MKIKITTQYRKILSDTYTPVSLYLRLRDTYPNALLLESSDYNKKQNSYSYICLCPLAVFTADREQATITFPGRPVEKVPLKEAGLADILHHFIQSFDIVHEQQAFLTQGLFGYTTYDAIPVHHPVRFRHTPLDIPLVHYQYFRFVLVFNHFNNELYLTENIPANEGPLLDELMRHINQNTPMVYPFHITGKVTSNYTDEEFIKAIEKGKAHCYRGDVFQIVLSRRFSQSFKGDEFNVYRALRSVNPSPYLFYFDYGSYKIMGSSPEAQITIQNNIASIYPIAGTFRRTGNTEEDEVLSEALKHDPKECAEHVMLVDLARNDLSINSDMVQVTKFKSVELYSHVIHLVSQVNARLNTSYNPIAVFLDTFPTGTLSGAPKRRAMQLIDTIENTNRGFYGGAVGIIGLDGSCNHAIFIRSVWSSDQHLNWQAGCGVVVRSVVENELQEIYNKTDAVQSAIAQAQHIPVLKSFL